jgi:NAD(P)-dependent dehydrogenase (short-subunit alcohol dehydrogenase family)
MMVSTPKIALITGAGTGIGKATAHALFEAGYSVVLAGRHSETLEATVAEAQVAAERALCVIVDVTNPESVQALFTQTKATFGRLDVLFNNAGIGGATALLEDIPYEEWRRILDTNLTGSFLCTQEAIKIMKSQTPQGGRIINNGSISAHAPRPNSVAYTASKHAITGLTKSTALDGRKYNIACSQLDIGNAATPMTARMKGGVPQANGDIVPEPTMDVNHVAHAVVYIANLPLEANVQFMTIMATQMPFIGRG